MHPLLTLARETAAYLERIDVADGDRTLRDAFVADLEDAGHPKPYPNAAPAGTVRGLRHAPTALAAMPEPTMPEPTPATPSRELAAAARAAFGHVRWTEFYAPDPWSEAFLPEFANGEGIGPDGALASDRMILGLFVLGPDTLYPPHAHPAEEFYLTLSGAPSFQIGAGEPFVPKPPGAVAWHGSNASHAIRTGPEPFLAVFGWRGAIRERSWYRDDMADPSLPVRHPTIAKG